MKKNSIIQFVGFETKLEPDEFYLKWENYSRDFMTVPHTTILQQEVESNSKFKYVSQHEFREQDLKFAFRKEGYTRYPPEQKIKVTQLGGFTPLQIGCRYYDETKDVKVMAFLGRNENDLEFYRELNTYRYLNIYQAYYESCQYPYVLEFFTGVNDAADLLQQLKSRSGTEAALYKECMLAKS
jgi:hypothetical protein